MARNKKIKKIATKKTTLTSRMTSHYRKMRSLTAQGIIKSIQIKELLRFYIKEAAGTPSMPRQEVFEEIKLILKSTEKIIYDLISMNLQKYPETEILKKGYIALFNFFLEFGSGK